MTDQMMMLVQTAMQQSRPSSSTGSKKDANDSSFRDMLAQKQQNNSTQQSSSSRGDAVKTENGQQATGQQTGNQQNPAGVDAETQQNAQMLAAAAMLAQMVLPQTEQAVIVPQGVEQTVAVQTAEVVQAAPVETVAAVPVVQQAEVEAEMPQIMPQTQQPQQTVEAAVQNAPQQQVVVQEETAQQTPMQQDNAQQNVEQPKMTDDQPEVVMTKAETPLFRDVEAVPVKVGENTPVVDTEAPDMEAKLADTVAKAELKQVGDKIEIQLEPHNLGRITIEMTQKDGQMGLMIHTENAKTANLLSQHSQGLAVLVENRTNQPVQIYVQQEQPQQPQYDGHNGQQPQEQQQQNRQHQDKDEQDSFLGQLRLGLVQLQ